MPLGALAYWIVQGSSTTLPSASIWGATANTVLFGLAAAALRRALALPVAFLAVRRRGAVVRRCSSARSTCRGRCPGWWWAWPSCSSRCATRPASTRARSLLVVAYTILFLPLALVALQPAVAQLTPGLEEVARCLG